MKSTGKRVSYTMESSLASVNRAEELAGRFAAGSGFEAEERDRIALAVREAMVNAVYHGNQYDPGKKVTIEFEIKGSTIVVRVSDQGAGFNANELPDPLAPENLLANHGRGIFLIRNFMDEVHFRALDPGTEITLIKRRGEPADSKEE